MSPDAEWMTDALCRGMRAEVFFPNDGGGVEAAAKVCAPCPVREACLEYAIGNRITFGVWGGASERERVRIRRRRAAAAAKARIA